MEDQLLAGRYRIGAVLGSGGAAKVHRAWDTRVLRPVAVKVFRGVPEGAELHRFQNEAHMLAMLSHPGLVDVFDAGADGNRPFIVLRLIEGHTLRDRIADGPVSVDAVRHLGARLAEALAYVHARGVTHRDVKPSNILLDAGGRPHLADFGVAKLIGSERVTATNEMIGTAAYLAPEQVRGHEVGSAADIYAFGLVLLECLTGTLEYDGTDVESALARLHRAPVIPAGVPADLSALLTRMTSLTPRRRPSAQECRDALSRVGEPGLSLAVERPLGGAEGTRSGSGSASGAAVTLVGLPARESAVAARGSARGVGGAWARRGLAAVAAGVVGVLGVWAVSGVDGSVRTPGDGGTAVLDGTSSGVLRGEVVNEPVKPVAETVAETTVPVQVPAEVVVGSAQNDAKKPKKPRPGQSVGGGPKHDKTPPAQAGKRKPAKP
ncbi:serine/threonine-protein kinase [Actinokineospora guangxiensis]|uniref:non-specific serine/threonine protein kinase n=1 Tax=Actinokineospora guangxiensis TaxID=1490288 RepID=A0ABW0EQC2_9PSEU